MERASQDRWLSKKHVVGVDSYRLHIYRATTPASLMVSCSFFCSIDDKRLYTLSSSIETYHDWASKYLSQVSVSEVVSVSSKSLCTCLRSSSVLLPAPLYAVFFECPGHRPTLGFSDRALSSCNQRQKEGKLYKEEGQKTYRLTSAEIEIESKVL